MPEAANNPRGHRPIGDPRQTYYQPISHSPTRKARLGYDTHPMKLGAPLPPEMTTLASPTYGELVDELDRAEIELMYALAKHRQAWASTRALLAQLQADGVYVDSDPTYIKTSGGIGFWRGEMEAQSAAIIALQELIHRREPTT